MGSYPKALDLTVFVAHKHIPDKALQENGNYYAVRRYLLKKKWGDRAWVGLGQSRLGHL